MLFFIALPLAAQRKVKVTILEKGTEQPIIAAVITCADNEKMEKPLRFVTDVNGEAVVELPQKGKVYYMVASVGFANLKGVFSPSTNEMKMHMSEDVMKVNEMVVTGSRTARPIKLSPVSTQVIGGKELVDAG